MKTFNTKVDFDSAYSFNAEPEGHPNTRKGIKIGYCREILLPWCDKVADKIIELLKITVNDNILFVGAGFGWTAECLENKGFKNIVCTDISDWVQENQNKNEESDIEEAIRAVGLNPKTGEGKLKKERLFKKEKRTRTKREIYNYNITKPEDRQKVLKVLSIPKFHIALTECVITTLEDGEVLNLSNAMHMVADEVIQIDIMKKQDTEPQRDEGYNWKFMNDWKELLPNDILIDMEGWKIG